MSWVHHTASRCEEESEEGKEEEELGELALHVLHPWGPEDPMLGAQASMGSHSKAKSEAGSVDNVNSTTSRPSPKPWQGPMPAPEVGWRGQGSTVQEVIICPPCLPKDDQNVSLDKTQDRQEPQILAGDGEGEWSLVVRPDGQQLPLDLETAFCSMFTRSSLQPHAEEN